MTTVDLTDSSPSRVPWQPFALWTAAVLVYAVALRIQLGLPFQITIKSSAVYFYSLALLMIPAQRWARRAMAEGRSRAAVVVGHLAFGIGTTIVWFGVNMLHDRIFVGPRFWEIIYAQSWLFQVLFGVTIYGTVMGVTMTSQAWRRDRERERREAELKILAREAQLGAVRAQFQPHFVLNALNSLLALIDTDPALARTMVVRLADVMKSVFERGDDAAIPLARELALVEAYLDVERIRFGPRLSTTFEIDDRTKQASIPPFLLQPVIENALKHGIAPNPRAGFVHVVTEARDARLIITVRNSLPDSDEASAIGTGQGLALTRRRLDTLYPERYELAFERDARTAVVRIVLPLKDESGL